MPEGEFYGTSDGSRWTAAMSAADRRFPFSVRSRGTEVTKMNDQSGQGPIAESRRTDNRLRTAVHRILQTSRPCLRRSAAIVGMVLAGSASPTTVADSFPAVFPLASLLPGRGGDGSTGFVLRGIAARDRSGHAVAGAGDVNGDGIDDLLIGGEYANPHGRTYAGESYVVFGTRKAFPPAFELSSLLKTNGGDGSVGFVLEEAIRSLPHKRSVLCHNGCPVGHGPLARSREGPVCLKGDHAKV